LFDLFVPLFFIVYVPVLIKPKKHRRNLLGHSEKLMPIQIAFGQVMKQDKLALLFTKSLLENG